MRILLLAFAILAGTVPLFAQTTPLELRLSGIYHNGEVRLRWIPLNFAAWNHGNQQGYVLERMTFSENGVILSGAQQLASRVTLLAQSKPLPIGDWEIPADTNDLAGVAAGMIYGDSLDVVMPEDVDIAHIYNLNQERDNRFGFSLFAADQDYLVAKMMGIAFVDTAVSANSKYMYNVQLYAPPAGVTIKPGYCSVVTDSAYTLPALEGLAAEPGDHNVTLWWERNDAHYTSYRINRAPNGSTVRTQLNEFPLTATDDSGAANGAVFFRDSLADNESPFTYFIQGLSPFGIWGPETSINNVKGKPKSLSVQITIDTIAEYTPGRLTVKWSFPDSLNDKISEFSVWRAVDSDSLFEQLDVLNPSSREFEDREPRPINYYLVKAVDNNDYQMTSFPQLGQLKDDKPPEKTGIKKGECDKNGLVTLEWLPSASEDVMGYRVFMSNAKGGDYTQITTDLLKGTTFTWETTLNTLSKEIYFTVVAVDFHHNQSAASDPYTVKRHDIIPPAKPSITEVTPGTGGVKFQFLLSTSDDVTAYHFQRMRAGYPGWITLSSSPAHQMPLVLEDSTASKRENYRYRLLAIDAQNNESISNIVEAKPINDGLREPMENLYAEKKPDHVKMSWVSEKNVDLTGYTIYRALDDSTKRRSFVFAPFPAPPNSSGNGAQVTGNQIIYTYYDYDIKFTESYNNSYAGSGSGNANKNRANKNISPDQFSAAKASFTGQPPTKIYYWVQAKYADGTVSPILGPFRIDLN
jgi:hypothetical protein